MIQLSIVIPKSAGAAQFEETLASVLGNRPDNCEVVVVTAGQYDDPYDLADEVDFVEAEPEAGLLDLINAGFRHARGEIVHLLLCSAEVQEGWTKPALLQFKDASVGSVAPLVLLSHDKECVASAGIRIGRGHTKLLAAAGQRLGDDPPFDAPIAGPTLAAAFYRRQAISQVHGVDPAVGPVLADLDLSLSLARLGYATRFEPTCRVWSAVPDCQYGGGFSQAQFRERLFWRHCSSLTSLLWHAVLVSGEFLWNVPRGRALSTLTGRLCGMLRAPLDRYARERASSAWPIDNTLRSVATQEEVHQTKKSHHQIRNTAA